MKTQSTELICNIPVLSKTDREQFDSLNKTFFAAVQEMRDLENGFAFRILNQPSQLAQVAQFIEREGQCCPFLKFVLEVEPSSGPIWLSVTGEAGTKEFLQAELDHIQTPERS